MLRRSRTMMCAGGASSTSTSTSTSAAAASSSASYPVKKADDSPKPKATAGSNKAHSRAQMFELRKSPFQLQAPNEEKMHSYLLSDSPVTLKMRREEALYRQRKLAEREHVEAELKAEADAEVERVMESSEGMRFKEVRYLYVIFFSGYVLGHYVGHQLFGPGEMRVPYDPVNGFMLDIEEKRKQYPRVDANLRANVLPAVAASKHASLLTAADK